MQQELVDQLRNKAKLYILIIQERVKDTFWHSWNEGIGLNVTLQKDNSILFTNPQLGAFQYNMGILFKNIRPKDITKTTLDKAVLDNTKQVDVSSTIIDNTSSDIDLDRTYTYEITTGTTLDTSVGVDATTSIEQSISYGGAAVQGTTNIGLSITTSYSRSSGESASTTRTVTTEFTVPAGKKANIDITQSVSDFTQECHYECAIDYNSYLRVSNLGTWIFDNVDSLIKTFEGKGEYTTDETLKQFQTNPIPINWDLNKLNKPINLDLEETVKFHNASTGNVTIKETDT